MNYAIIVIGASSGGLSALEKILPIFPKDFAIPIVIVQHISPRSDNFYVRHFENMCALTVKEAEFDEPIEAGYIYFAPPGYHLLIQEDRTFTLSLEGKVNYAIPSIDVLFESAADIYREKVLGLVLTGANNDGAKGARYIRLHGGKLIIQDPATAEIDTMPREAIKLSDPHYILPLNLIGEFILYLEENEKTFINVTET